MRHNKESRSFVVSLVKKRGILEMLQGLRQEDLDSDCM